MDEDSTIVRRVLDGDREAFRVLVERHQARLFGYAGALLSGRHDREDVVQDSFLAAFANLDRFDPRRGTFAGWLFRIVRNRALNEIARKRPVPLPRVPEPGPTVAARGEPELLTRLDRALAALPFAQRSAFLLAEVHDLPHAEIARIEGVRTGTVKSRVARARARLREALGRARERRA